MAEKDVLLIHWSPMLEESYSDVVGWAAPNYEIVKVVSPEVPSPEDLKVEKVCMFVADRHLLPQSQIKYTTISDHNKSLAREYLRNPANPWGPEALDRFEAGLRIAATGIPAHLAHPNSFLSNILKGKTGMHFVPVFKP